MRLDHVIVAVRDLDAAVAAFEPLLGRPVALRSDHPRGTRNALFLFEGGPYLELLGLWDAPEQGTSAAALRQRLAMRGEGLSGLALAPEPEPIEDAIARLRVHGAAMTDPLDGSGTDAEGQVRRWRAAALPETAGDRSYLVEHQGQEWRRHWLPEPLPGRERSAVRGIDHVAFDVEDAEAASARWAAWLAMPATRRVRSEGTGAVVIVHDGGAASVEFVSATDPDGAVARRMAARGAGLSSLALQVDDLQAAVVAARAAGIAAGDPEPGVLPSSRVARIAPESAGGVAAQYICFT